YLTRQGITVLKFFLHVSREEQLGRLRERIDDKDKNWKFSASDLETPQHWPKYVEAYEDMLVHTASKAAPWYIVPADRKWAARLVVANIVVNYLSKLDLHYPKPDPANMQRLAEAKAYIDKELGSST